MRVTLETSSRKDVRRSKTLGWTAVTIPTVNLIVAGVKFSTDATTFASAQTLLEFVARSLGLDDEITDRHDVPDVNAYQRSAPTSVQKSE